MLKVYVLPVKRVGNTDEVAGIEYIHGGMLTYGAGVATLIQDVTPEEDAALSALALESRAPTEKEMEIFKQAINEMKLGTELAK